MHLWWTKLNFHCKLHKMRWLFGLGFWVLYKRLWIDRQWHHLFFVCAGNYINMKVCCICLKSCAIKWFNLWSKSFRFNNYWTCETELIALCPRCLSVFWLVWAALLPAFWAAVKVDTHHHQFSTPQRTTFQCLTTNLHLKLSQHQLHSIPLHQVLEVKSVQCEKAWNVVK